MSTSSVLRFGIRFVVVCTLVAGCSDDEPGGWRITEGAGDEVNYGADAKVVVSADGTIYVVEAQGSGCAQVGDQCVDLAGESGRYCDDPNAQADVLLDQDGKVVTLVCYPPVADGTSVEELQTDAEGNVSLPSNQNGVVITFPEDTNGAAVAGNIALDGERVVLYGNGVDQTIVDGNLDLLSNNARVRGLTVKGDVHFHSNSNNSSLLLCRIEGNLNVESNGATLASCEVFGDVRVSGNNAVLVNIGVQGEWDVDSGATCEGCYSFSDDNDDLLVQDSELGDAIDCGNPG